MFANGHGLAFADKHTTKTLGTAESVRLLKRRGIKGSEQHLQQAAKDFCGSELNIKLLASYLNHWSRSDVRKLDNLPSLQDMSQEGIRTRRLLAAHASKLRHSRELSTLYFLSLFDSTTSLQAIQSILKSMHIGILQRWLKRNDEFIRLFAPIAGYKAHHFTRTCENLRSLSLVPVDGQEYLTHYPAVQQFFRQQFRSRHPQAWQSINQMLAQYFNQQCSHYYPQDKDDLRALTMAIKHLCAIGNYQQAFIELYWKRVRREEVAYITRVSHAYDIDLFIITHFFKGSWQQPVQNLATGFKTLLLKWAHEDLMHLGRTREAISVLETLTEQLARQKKWVRAVHSSKLIRQLHLKQGNIQQAIAAGRQSIVYADLSNKPAEMIRALLELVKVLHEHGSYSEASDLFLQAEKVFKTTECDDNIALEIRNLRAVVKTLRGKKTTLLH